MSKIILISLRLVAKELLELDRHVKEYGFQDKSKFIRWCVFGRRHKDQKTLLFQNAILMIHAQIIEVNNSSIGFDEARWSSLMEKLEKLIDGHQGELR